MNRQAYVPSRPKGYRMPEPPDSPAAPVSPLYRWRAHPGRRWRALGAGLAQLLPLACAVYLYGKLLDAGEAWTRVALADAAGLVACGVDALLVLVLAFAPRVPAPNRCALARGILYLCAFAVVGTWLLPSAKPGHLFRAFLLWAAALLLLLLLLRALSAGVRAALASKWMRRIDLLLGNLLLAALLLEPGLRGLAAVTHNPLLSRPDMSAVKRIEDQRLPRGVTRLGYPVNRDGYYDTEFARARAPGTLRVLGVGDSFAVGMVPYPRNVLTLLEDDMSRRLKRPVEILNVGLEGLGPQEYLHQIRTLGPAYDCDFTLVLFFVGNDILVRDKRTPGDLGRCLLTAEWWYVGMLSRRLARVAGELLRAEGASLSAEHRGGDIFDESRPTFGEGHFLHLEHQRMAVCAVPQTPDVRAAYAAAKASLVELRDAAGGRVLVALLPDEFQVNDALWREVRTTFGLRESDYDRFRPQRELADFCAAQGIACVDLLPALRAAEGEARTYLPRDTHWNTRGNRVAAGEVAAALAQALPAKP